MSFNQYIERVRKALASARTLDSLRAALPQLWGTGLWTEREERLIYFRFEEHLTLDDVANRLNISAVRARQIENVAFRKMWNSAQSAKDRLGGKGTQ